MSLWTQPFLFVKFSYFERERESTQAREGQREGERITIKLHDFALFSREQGKSLS